MSRDKGQCEDVRVLVYDLHAPRRHVVRVDRLCTQLVLLNQIPTLQPVPDRQQMYRGKPITGVPNYAIACL